MQVDNNQGLLVPAFIAIESITTVKQQLATIDLTLKIAKEACKALLNKKLEAFDAHVCDFGCQLRAIMVYNYSYNGTILAEAETLIKMVDSVRDELNAAKSRASKDRPVSVSDLLNNKVNFKISNELKILTQAFLLRTVRGLKVVEDEGTQKEVFITDKSRLDALIKGVDGDIRDKMIEMARAQLSKSSIEYLRSLKQEPMLAPQYILKERIDKRKKDSLMNSLCIGYFSYKSILEILKERQIPILIKKLVLKDQPTYGVLLRSTKTGGGESLKIEPNQPIIVFEGKLDQALSKESLKDKIMQLDVYKLLLASGAQTLPYMGSEDKSLDEQLKKEGELDPEVRYEVILKKMIPNLLAQQELLASRSMGRTLKSTFDVDHVYCSTLGEEAKLCNGKENIL